MSQPESMPQPGFEHNAAPSALGYFYQVRYGLVLLLQSTEPNSVMSIEKLDDVAFEEGGEPKELLQFKHHVSHTAALTDSSTDLWKTLRIWASQISDGSLDLSVVILSLVTTAVAPVGSSSSLLRPNQYRNEDEALRKLHHAGQHSRNEVVIQAYQTFRALSDVAQRTLLSRIRVVDAAPDILRSRELLESILRYSTRTQFLILLCDRLEGWWFRVMVEHLKNPDLLTGVPLREVQIQIADLAEQFRLESLPVDFPVEVEIDESTLRPDERLFVEQLRLAMVGSDRIKRAISDYWRAFQQRSKWVREKLLLDYDLEQYEDILIREWSEHFRIMKENMTEDSDTAREGRTLYNNLVILGRHIPIRPTFTNPYVMRGSFHMLANTLKVGWHPLFKERLAEAFERVIRTVI